MIKATQVIVSGVNCLIEADVIQEVEKALESARCAYINLNNMTSIMPAMKQHPLLPMVKAQLCDAIIILDPEDSGPCPKPPLPPPLWRVGRKVGHTIYRDNVLVGMMDTPELAQLVMDAMNLNDRTK